MIEYVHLVTQIVATNNSWHAAEELFASNSSIIEAARNAKSRLQLRLLRSFSDKAYLEVDETEGEHLYSIKLRLPIKVEIGTDCHTRTDATHLPARIVENWLDKKIVSQQELDKWFQR